MTIATYQSATPTLAPPGSLKAAPIAKRRPLVIFHGNCADGFSAAWCFHKKYGAGNCDFHHGKYGSNPPDVVGRDVFLVDFSYKREIVEMMIEEAATVTLIDHHKTAIDDLAGLEGLHQYIDLNRSGATLAWDYLFGNESRPLLLGHVEDRDLWRFKLPNTREIQSTVFSYEYTFENWDRLMAADSVELLKMTVTGAALDRKHHKDIRDLLAVCKRTMTIGGFAVPVASLPYTMASDAGHVMSVGSLEFAACYWDTKEHRVFSLRSQPDGMDVSVVAEGYGGGGHRNAAGFRVPRDHELATA